ncbi:acyl-CoA dehydrogenase family protein [Nocardia sp. NBC_00416]|uniref:acyl-CoA dehydrogenase family protein n=1 Tax=Nocardia sp. NBC_00416 TaxID=2975991 RepID=UPI002E1A3B43
MDTAEQTLLTDALRKTMTTSTGPNLYPALCALGWHDLLTGPADTAEIAVALVFRLLGETGAQAPLINDVVAHAAGRPLGESLPLPFTGGTWVRWSHRDLPDTEDLLDPGLPLLRLGDTTELPAAADLPKNAARRALGWWLVGSARAMLALARTHALERHQFGRPVAGFQAIRHRLAETLVAIEGAEAALTVSPGDAHQPAHPDTGSPRPEESEALSALLAKAAAGRAALVTARNCQQVLGGTGFTSEHEFHRHYKRALMLDGLLGSSRELTREAGATLRNLGYAPRLAHL